MYNIKAAVGRLEFAPSKREMEVTDIRTGHFVFSPLLDKEVSYEELKKAIEGAGYEIDRAIIEVSGELVSEAERHLRVGETGQVFHLEGEVELETLQREVAEGEGAAVSGEWSEREGVQVIRVQKWSPAGKSPSP